MDSFIFRLVLFGGIDDNYKIVKLEQKTGHLSRIWKDGEDLLCWRVGEGEC